MARGWRFYGIFFFFFFGLGWCSWFWMGREGLGWVGLGWDQVGLDLLSLWVFLLGHDATIPRKCFLFDVLYVPYLHFSDCKNAFVGLESLDSRLGCWEFFAFENMIGTTSLLWRSLVLRAVSQSLAIVLVATSSEHFQMQVIRKNETSQFQSPPRDIFQAVDSPEQPHKSRSLRSGLETTSRQRACFRELSLMEHCGSALWKEAEDALRVLQSSTDSEVELRRVLEVMRLIAPTEPR